MTVESLNNYLSTRLPLQINARQHFQLLGTVFVLVFASSVIIHLLVQQDKTLLGTLIHASVVGVIYVVGVGIAVVFLHVFRDTKQEIRVWHVWVVSMASFVVGYYFLPLNELLVEVLGVDTEDHIGSKGFPSLLPVWFLVTYLFIQPYLNDGLKSELARLRRINDMLEGRDLDSEETGQQLIRFESGKTEFSIRADSIQNIVVEDHYCYVHYKKNGGYLKQDLALPLRDVLTLLPPGFAQVHRSHIVNLKYIASVQRKNRNIRLILSGGYEVPVSRHRLDEVLPLLQKAIRSRN